jgi:hypothetical protein
MEQLSAVMVNAGLLIDLFREPSITAYNRLEPRPRTHDFSRSLRAEVRDALWMLTRQWQLGELEAEDAGSPIDARLVTRRLHVDRVRIGSAPPQTYDDSVPLEALAERERIPFTHALRLQAAAYFLKLHPATLRAKYLPRYRTAFGFPPDPAPAVERQVDGRNLYVATQRLGFDGEAVLNSVRDGTFGVRVGIDGSDVAPLATVTAAFVEWFERQYSQPAGEHPAGWDASRLTYSLSASAPDADGQAKTLVAERYDGARLDWHSFDLDAEAAPLDLSPGAPPPAAPHVEVMSFLPTPARFKGMPNARFWEMEERQVNFGALNAKTTDQLLLVFAEMGLVYGNDWFVFPYKLPVNSLCEVQGLVVTDVFGERTVVRAADEGDESRWQRWSLFDLSNRREPGSYNHQFLLPSVLGQALESEPVERVQFVRDETANLVWAVEEVVPDATGRGVDGHDAADKTGVQAEPIPGSPAAIRYVLGTTVPENWIPFLPAQRPGSVQDIALQRAAMPRLGSAPGTVVAAKGVLLNEQELPWFVNEEEVPQAGTILTRSYQRARWYGGRTFLWLGRRRQTGRGVGSSGLRFDDIEPT